ncbi:MAG: DUF2723 domain-containing protein [Nannocystaceae bacterium]
MSQPVRFETRGPKSLLFTRGLLLVVLAQFLAHVLSLSPGVTPSDGPEIATAIVTLGVIHPTGYPLFTLVAHVFTWLPIPIQPVVKIELMNACFVGGSSVLIALIVRSIALRLQGLWPSANPSLARLWPRRTSDERPPPAHTRTTRERSRDTWEADIAGILGGFMLGVSPLLWKYMRIPEVYAMHVFLVTWALYYWTRFELCRRPAYVLWAAVPMGIGLAHHVTMVYMLPAAGLYLLARRPYQLVAWFLFPVVFVARRLGAPRLMSGTDFRAWWIVWLGCIIGALPLLSYGYFLWAHKTTDGVSWGGITDWNNLYRHMTGRQYQAYMKGWEYADFGKRIAGIPNYFDKQFLAGTALMWGLGVVLAFKRLWPYAAFIALYSVLNLYHGAQYSVGDFYTYYLPAAVTSSMAIGIGLWWSARYLCYRPEGRTLQAWGIASAALMVLVAGALYYYEHIATPRPRHLPAFTDAALVAPLLAASLLALLIPGVLRYRRLTRKPDRKRARKPAAPARYRGLSLCMLAAVGAIFATVGVARSVQFRGTAVRGEAYARSVVRSIPAGGVYLTIGDGKIFPMWYLQHVLNEGREIAVVDGRMIQQTWYRNGHLKSHHPASCDPLAPRFRDDLTRFFLECGTYRQRLDAYSDEKRTWLKLDTGSTRSGRRTKRTVPLDHKINDGGDPKCQEAAYRRTHRKPCACWDYNTHKRQWDHQCVYTTEERAIVRLHPRETYAHRVIEDHIDERPVYERNVFTRNERKTKNVRGWDRAAFRRISGQYHLINRGRANQIVYWDEVRGIDPCGGGSLATLPQPVLQKPTPKPILAPLRRPYKTNERPQLMSHSLLTPQHKGNGDDERFTFEPGADVHLSMTWFERNVYNSKRKNRRGAHVLYGVRVCFFDPAGRKIHTESVRTTGKVGRVRLPSEETVMSGTYTVQACTVGEVGRTKGQPVTRKARVPDHLPCLYPLLEYEFNVRAPDL